MTPPLNSGRLSAQSKYFRPRATLSLSVKRVIRLWSELYFNLHLWECERAHGQCFRDRGLFSFPILHRQPDVVNLNWASHRTWQATTVTLAKATAQSLKHAENQRVFAIAETSDPRGGSLVL
jgi:hypothetical protein